MLGLIAQLPNPEPFNEDFIFLRRNDRVLEYAEDICKALELIDGIQFVSASIETDESAFSFKNHLDVEDSRVDLLKLKFVIDTKKEKEEREEIELKLLYPKLIDGFYYILNGNRYFPILQIIDASTYRTGTNAITLKTLLMGITVATTDRKFEDINKEEYVSKVMQFDIFKKKINILNYFFAKFGYEGALEYFGVQDLMGVMPADQLDTDNDDYIFTEVGCGLMVYFAKSILHEHYEMRLAITLIELMNSCEVNIDRLHNEDFWKRRLGSMFTKNNSNQAEKGAKILVSLERILDNRTKKVLRTKADNKENIYAISRWMCRNFDKMLRRDTANMKLKRVRCAEYNFYPLILKFSKAVYRIQNSKIVTKKALKSIFSNIKYDFLIKGIIKSEMNRYSQAVNGIDLFNSAIRYSMRGPQSLSSGKSGSSIAMKHRDLHPSQLGRVGLASGSNSDPGLSGVLTPYVTLDDNWFFIDPEDKLYCKLDDGTEEEGELCISEENFEEDVELEGDSEGSEEVEEESFEEGTDIDG